MGTNRKRTGVRAGVLTALVSAVALLAVAVPNASAGVGQRCPGTFTVEHNDHIGRLQLNAGPYYVKVKRMSCGAASTYFARFLDYPSGTLPDGWSLNVRKAKFRNAKQNISFRVSPVKGAVVGGSGGGGGKSVCPGTFQVLHNDHIGRMNVPAGRYQITVKRLSCSGASGYFKQFLTYPDGKLPSGWKMNVAKQKFRNTLINSSFWIKRVSN